MLNTTILAAPLPHPHPFLESLGIGVVGPGIGSWIISSHLAVRVISDLASLEIWVTFSFPLNQPRKLYPSFTGIGKLSNPTPSTYLVGAFSNVPPSRLYVIACSTLEGVSPFTPAFCFI